MDKMTIGALITAVAELIPIGMLIYKYGKVVSMIEQNNKDITDLKNDSKNKQPQFSRIEENTRDIAEIKENQKTYQMVIEKSLDEIKTSLSAMNTTLALLTSRLDYVEDKKSGTHQTK